MKHQLDDLALFGGKPEFASVHTTMNLYAPSPDIFFERMNVSFSAHRLSNNGPNVQELEVKLAAFHGVKHCVAVCNGFMASTLALQALALPGKTQVVVPALSYRRTPDIIHWIGLEPCYCDVDRHTLGMTPATAEVYITEKTAAILAPHPRCMLCDAEGLEKLALRMGIPLVFDSVEASGSEQNGRLIGGFGDAESFSLHASKLINGGEGGYITTNNDALAELLRRKRAFGFDGQDHIVTLGCNGKLNELHAAVALASLAGMPETLAYNQACFAAYERGLAQLPDLRLMQEEHESDAHRTCKSVLVEIRDTWPLSRAETLAVLNAERIFARPYYAPPQEYTAMVARDPSAALPVTDWAAERFFYLPLGATVPVSDVPAIIDILSFCYQHAAAIRQALGQSLTLSAPNGETL